MAKYVCIKKALDYFGVLYTSGSTLVQGWLQVGNVSNDTTDFIGTTNDSNLRFKRNNIYSGFLSSLSTAFGVDSGNYPLDNTTQSGNTYFGRKSGKNSIGSENTFIGSSAGENNEESQVTSIGINSGNGNSGMNLSSLGFQSGLNNSGVNVSSLGPNSANGNSGDDVVALGNQSAKNNVRESKTINFVKSYTLMRK